MWVAKTNVDAKHEVITKNIVIEKSRETINIVLHISFVPSMAIATGDVINATLGEHRGRSWEKIWRAENIV